MSHNGSRYFCHFPVHLLAPKSNCQKGNAPEKDFSSGADASRFGLHGSRQPEIDGHLLAIVPPPPPPSQMNHHHHPMTNPLTPACLPHCYHHHPSKSLFQPTNQCNGFVKIPCPCSSIGGGVASIDDESVSIPTPPPAVTSGYPRDCPVHYQQLLRPHLCLNLSRNKYKD
ncbi:hypothetical protein DAPPUDRAFT_254727 [Daphnia pulex]|uniref:Uncharacterized protein n=1 Tax=Daphnia pulex TaxID=6669 RepID=E9H7R5_DAPPU|nr:hypothetical protein DAPPUDRAFT_254727 [Daphnia pulex]|eukprot:EFX72257.1 hypothetical protein DAPPUDRAFT_254727 [Daphnia pulex]